MPCIMLIWDLINIYFRTYTQGNEVALGHTVFEVSYGNLARCSGGSMERYRNKSLRVHQPATPISLQRPGILTDQAAEIAPSTV